jgi:hypothetical protein
VSPLCSWVSRRDVGLRHPGVDRATALESAFATNFREITGQPTFERGFCSLQQAHAPLLLPGLTDARLGKRVVLSCLKRTTPSIDLTMPEWLPAGPRLSRPLCRALQRRRPTAAA